MRFSRALIMVAVTLLGASGVHSEEPSKSGVQVVVPPEWLQDHMEWTHLSTILSVAGGVAAFLISTYFVVKQLKDTHDWNVRKTSEETLSALITGDFPRLMDRLILDFGWDILAYTTYEEISKKVSADQLVQLDVTLRNILRYLEVICIHMKNGIVDEEMCFDYLRSIMTTFYSNCDSFIQKERERRREKKIFNEVEHYGSKWRGLIVQETEGASYSKIRKAFRSAG